MNIHQSNVHANKSHQQNSDFNPYNILLNSKYHLEVNFHPGQNILRNLGEQFEPIIGGQSQMLFDSEEIRKEENEFVNHGRRNEYSNRINVNKSSTHKDVYVLHKGPPQRRRIVDEQVELSYC